MEWLSSLWNSKENLANNPNLRIPPKAVQREDKKQQKESIYEKVKASLSRERVKDWKQKAEAEMLMDDSGKATWKKSKEVEPLLREASN